MFPEIQCLPIEQGGYEDLTVVLCRIEVSRCSLSWVWDNNAHPLHTPVYPPLKIISDLLPPAPYQGWEKSIPQFYLHYYKEGPDPRGDVLDKLPLLMEQHCQDGIDRLVELS